MFADVRSLPDYVDCKILLILRPFFHLFHIYTQRKKGIIKEKCLYDNSANGWAIIHEQSPSKCAVLWEILNRFDYNIT